MFAKAQDGVFTAEPDTFDVDCLSQVPDLLGRVNGVGVVGVHDTGIVEHDVHATPGVEMIDQCGDVGFLGNVTDFCLDFES